MRSGLNRRSGALVGTLLAFVLMFAGVAHTSASATATSALPARRLPPETMRAGDVTIKLTPRQISDRWAVFEISMDTHSTDLDVDVAKAARLRVGGIEWPEGRYTGDGPGGHHREGVLRFRGVSTSQGAIRLTINAFGDSVTARWRM